jgi:hypothetical protein
MRNLLLIIPFFFFGCKDDTSTKEIKKVEAEKSSGLGILRHNFKHKVDSLLPLARSYVKQNNYNPEYIFVADLSLHSGFERFAVVDLKKDTILRSGLVAHGAGGKYWAADARYSNTPNSLCSSPGKYRIDKKYNGRFGKAYKLHGLDKTNSKAFERFIVLHAYDCVPDKTLYPDYLCNSEGCPMVSYKFLEVLSHYIDRSKKPVLLWIIG